MQPVVMPNKPPTGLTLTTKGTQMHKPGWSCRTYLGDNGQRYTRAAKTHATELIVEWYWLMPLA
ncbi:MAG: hypothetical protein KKD44_28980 [Proteobacteria bacterium]|nr:hypothetical protein [Pseudomonadota bacterium]HUW96776.1 hypothetical protein [Anaerolineae bacterium]